MSIVLLTQYSLNPMTTQNPILIDIPDDPPHQEWNEREWIGVGKKYPVSGEVPAFIEAARSKVLAVPSIYSLYIPKPKMSITDLLKAKLPIQSSALIMHSATGAFSKEEPNEDMACLKTRPIPPKAWLEQLDKDFGQAWFNDRAPTKRYITCGHVCTTSVRSISSHLDCNTNAQPRWPYTHCRRHTDPSLQRAAGETSRCSKGSESYCSCTEERPREVGRSGYQC